MKTVIHGQYIDKTQLLYLNDLINIADKSGVFIAYSHPFIEEIRKEGMQPRSDRIIHSYRELWDYQPDFFITLGGDGTILQSITWVRDSNIPIVGINLGRLGFLASIEKKSIIPAMQDIFSGKFRIENRSVLSLTSNIDIYGDARFALNDFTITKRDGSAMIKISIFINEKLLNTIWADGIIVATPTGSTGYSLSCGGPILFPDAANFVITPIAPHNLTVRPIVIPDTEIIDISVEGRSEQYLSTLDSRSELITKAHKIRLTKCPFTIQLAYPHTTSFMETISSKLMWGLDIRN
ncbi:MAG TPA: NAD kinase [Saprospiraceae bacterium]|nr:NAD kinase [Saprospiraceae bacterium]